jgi:NADPH:quinone reductase-like Zn-dependent oxidoreductase
MFWVSAAHHEEASCMYVANGTSKITDGEPTVILDTVGIQIFNEVCGDLAYRCINLDCGSV